MSDWLKQILEEFGWKCLNCGQWRILKGREIETCPECGDEAFDIYEANEEKVP